MIWPDLFKHGDGLVHIIGRHLGRAYVDDGLPDHARVAHAECGVPLACINTEIHTMPMYLQPNTKAKFPTCIACIDRSNFGTYAPR